MAWRNFPYFVIGLIGSVLIVLAHREYGGIKEAPGGTIGRSILLMIWVTGDYAASILTPLNLNPLYIYPTDTLNFANPQVWAGLFVLAWLAIVGILQPFGKPLSLFTVLWVGAMMLPVSNIIPIAIQRADRYMYYPSILLFALVGIALVKLWDWSHQHVQWRTVMLLNGAFMLALLLFLTYEQNKIWYNEDTLWADNLRDYPNSETGLLNRGVHFLRVGDDETATTLFTRLVELYPNHYKGNRFLGIIAFRQQRYSDAAYYLRRTLQVSPNDDTRDELGLSLIELGLFAHNGGDYQQAQTLYLEAQQYVPNEPILYNNLGFNYYRLGDLQNALTNYEQAVTLKPDYLRAWSNMGVTARQLGDNALAIQAFETALNLGADFGADSNINYCVALAESNAAPESALPYCQAGIIDDPNNAFYLALNAHALLIYGQAEAALTSAQAAVQLNPNLSLGYRCLGDAHALLGQPEAAIAAYQQALALDADNRRAAEGLARLTNPTP
jgi:tetratricopeptide (TPR) repeat protein